jgi:hypothetical protein
MYARILTAMVLTAWAAATAFAQEPAACTDSESLQGCFSRIQREAAPAAQGADVEAVEEAQKQDVKQELTAALTGAALGGDATAATKNDLAQLLNALGLLSSGDAQGSKIAVDLNFLLPVQDVENNNAQLRGIINTEPEPLDQLVQAFGETVREARKDSLQKDIAAFGDAQISFTWGLVNRRFGRDYSVLRDQIAPMNEGAVNRARSAARTDSIRAFPAVIARANEAVRAGNEARQRANPGSPAIPTTATFGELPISNELKAELKAATFKAANERAAITQGIQAELARSSLDRLAELVEQQPQLLFTLSHDFRDEIVGPESTSATVTWELNGRNFGAFLRNQGRSCAGTEVATGTSPQYDSCVSALQSYLGGDAIQNQWRFKLEASFKRIESVDYSFPVDGVDVSMPKHDRWEVAAAAGRPLSNDKNGGRLDFELAFDSNLDDDTTNEERVTAALTYTRRVGDMDMPFSIVYANKDEFLGEVDHQLSLNLGLKFRQPKK